MRQAIAAECQYCGGESARLQATSRDGGTVVSQRLVAQPPPRRLARQERKFDRLIDQLPKSGTVVIVGHSLGSLIAIDLLDHLRGTINVRRLVTIGSPAGHLALLGKKNPLLRKFPLSRVMSWANLWSLGDPVCYGCGIAHYFPHALDVRIGTAIARHKLGLPRYDRIWLLLCELESQIARQRQGLVPFSDADAPSVKALERKAGAVRRAIEYLVDHGLAPLLP